jgi:hypothetical protein
MHDSGYKQPINKSANQQFNKPPTFAENPDSDENDKITPYSFASYWNHCQLQEQLCKQWHKWR